MLNVNLNEIDSIAVLVPDGKLSEVDFKSVCEIIDPYIERSGKLKGIMIHVKSFPGWDSFSALITHLKFVKEHHKKVSHVALVTDSSVAIFAEHIATHFISAKIKSFAFNNLDEAKQWIINDDKV